MALIHNLLFRDEGCRFSAYSDQFGFTTIGIGRCIDSRRGGGISMEEADYLLQNDIQRVTRGIQASFPEFSGLNEARQAVLISIGFQLGISGLLGFHKALNHIRNGDFSGAANEFLDSDWAKQTPARALRLAETMRTGDPADLKL